MTDLTGTELALAVARVMGRDKALIGLPGVVMDIDLDDWPAYEAQKWHLCWRPDQGGAAAWEVLEWVLGQRLHVEMWRDRLDGCTVCWILDRTGNGRLVADVIGPADGPTDAIALCRAVVALGEAG